MKYVFIISVLLVIGFIFFDKGLDENTKNFDYGYDKASENEIDNFEECQNLFGTGEAEDGCNEYVKENYTGYKTFGDYECTEDCSGHEAGYNWAEENGISDIDDCTGKSDSFIEGCITYVEENY